MPGPWGKAIEHLRLAKRLTRETVAKRAKMTATTYGRIERGQHTQTRKLQDIADVFGVSIDEVLIGPGRRPVTDARTQSILDVINRAAQVVDAAHAPTIVLPQNPEAEIERAERHARKELANIPLPQKRKRQKKRSR